MILSISAALAAPPPGLVLPGAADADRGDLTVVGSAFRVEDGWDGSQVRGGSLQVHADVDDRLSVALGVAHDRYDNGWIPSLSVRGLVVDQEHVRMGLHVHGGAWLKRNASDVWDDTSSLGIGWSLAAGGDRVVFDIARTPVAVTLYENDFGAYWEPWRGPVQEIGLTVQANDHHGLRIGVLSWVPVASYRYGRDGWHLQVAAGATRSFDMDYTLVGAQIGWSGNVWGDPLG